MAEKAAGTEAGPGAPLGSLPVVTHGHPALPTPLPSSSSVSMGVTLAWEWALLL